MLFIIKTDIIKKAIKNWLYLILKEKKLFKKNIFLLFFLLFQIVHLILIIPFKKEIPQINIEEFHFDY